MVILDNLMAGTLNDLLVFIAKIAANTLKGKFPLLPWKIHVLGRSLWHRKGLRILQPKSLVEQLRLRCGNESSVLQGSVGLCGGEGVVFSWKAVNEVKVLGLIFRVKK